MDRRHHDDDPDDDDDFPAAMSNALPLALLGWGSVIWLVITLWRVAVDAVGG